MKQQNKKGANIMSAIKIGWSEVSITPDKPVALEGQFAERISQYVEKPITATAFAVESDTEQMVLCSTDLVSVSGFFCETVREKLKDNGMGLDPLKVVISAIHTHTGPGYRGRNVNASSKFDGKRNSFRGSLESVLPPGKTYVESADVSGNQDIASLDELLTFLTDRVAQCILEAWKNRKAGSFTNAFGRAAVGMCRRAAYSDGSAQMWGDTNAAVFTELEGGNDSGVELLYVFGANKELTGIVINIACPAQCVQHRLFVSPDFWGEAKMLLREHFGEDLFILPLCGAAGDQCPVDLVRWVEPESDVHDPNITRKHPLKRKADPSMFDIAGMKKAGKRIANEVIEVYNEGLDDAQEAVPFEHRVEMMQLPLRRATLAEEKEARKAIADYLRDKPGDTVDFNDAAKLQIYLGVLRRIELQNVMDIVETEIHIIRLGSIAIASNPFELFLDYGNQIKARSHAEQTFLIQLAAGCESYLPTEKAEKGGHYSAFIASGEVGHVGGDQLVRETLKNINEMFAE